MITKEQKDYIIKLLQNGEELPEEFKYFLFPTKQKEYELAYAGKIRKEDLLANEDGVFPVPLQIERVFNGVEYNAFDDGWKNMIIFGDNLQFLKTVYENKDPLIKDEVKGKVKLIYIDPPFGTGDEYDGNKGQSAYSAKRKGADFVEFIRKRMLLAKEIISDEGVIVVRQAYNFGYYIKIILDEIFGKDYFVNEVIIGRKREGAGTRNKFDIVNESLYIFSNSQKYCFNDFYAQRPISEIKWTSFLMPEERNPKERTFFSLTLYPPKGQHFSLKQEKCDKLLKEHFLRLRCKDCGAKYYYSESEEKFERTIRNNKYKFKFYDLTSDSIYYPVTEIKKCIKCNSYNFTVDYLGSDNLKINNNWLDIRSYKNSTGYPTENSEELLYRVIDVFSDKDDLVVDFFAGSGTTAVVSEKLGRRWIVCDIGKLSFFTMQKRILQIQDSKNLDNPKKLYSKKANSFITCQLGLYDLKKALDLEWKKYQDFVSGLFEVEIIPHKVSGFEFDGKKGEYPVKMFDYRKFKDSSVNEKYLQEIHKIIGNRISGRIYIIAPANYVDFLTDYHEIAGLRYYFLKIPYQVIKELHKIPFQKLRQPQSKKNVNDLDETVGFHFIRQPEVKSKLIVDKTTVQIKIQEFKSQYFKDEDGKTLENFETLSSVFIDNNYNGKYFEMDEAFFADDLLPKKKTKKEENGENIREELKEIKEKGLIISLKKSDIGKQIMIVYTDIYGNDFTELLKVK